MENNKIKTFWHVYVLEKEYGDILQVVTDVEYPHGSSMLLCDRHIERFPLTNGSAVLPKEIVKGATIILRRGGDVSKGLNLKRSAKIDISLPSKYRFESEEPNQYFYTPNPIKLVVDDVDYSDLFNAFDGIGAPSLVYTVSHAFFNEGKIEHYTPYYKDFEKMSKVLNNIKEKEKQMIFNLQSEEENEREF